jgi:hypothetical protein
MYWIVGIIPIAVQVLLIIHVIKSGRDRFWIYILIFIPIAGPLAYFFVEILPALLSDPKTARLKNQLSDSINPGRKITELELQLDTADTMEHRKRLADEYMRNGSYEKAISLYESCLEGIYKEDTYILQSLAEAYYHNRDLPGAKRVLERLEKQGELSRHYNSWFVYVKILEETGLEEEAEQQYQALEGTYPRLEVLFNHGKFLQKLSKESEAEAKFREMVKIGRQLPKHVLKLDRRWLNLARKELSD